MKIPVLCLTLLYAAATPAQTVQWASELVEFSSQHTDGDHPNTTWYKAVQVLGFPNTPRYGISELAWAPGKEEAAREFLTVGFAQPQYVQQVIIGETFNPGAVREIILFDEKGGAHTVYENKNTVLKNHYGQVLISYQIAPTAYRADRLKLVLQTGSVGGMQQIDCIGISNAATPVKLPVQEVKYQATVAEPENLGPGVNSEYFDHLPLISPDGSALFFTRKFADGNLGEEQKDDIYYSYRMPDGSFAKASNIGPPLNTEGHNFVCYIGTDNNTVYVANKYRGSNQGGISVSKKQANGSWGNPAVLKVPELYNQNEFAHYHLSLDEKTLLACIQRADSYGDLDIYVSFQYADGTWSPLRNLGPVINTVGAEGSVFLAADSKTLYFASTGHQGYGHYDMYMTKRLDNTWTNWSKPLNLGPRINSPDMDIYYTIPASGDYAYFSSGRTIYGRNDLYRIKLPPEVRPEPVTLPLPSAALKGPSVPLNATTSSTAPQDDLLLKVEALKKQQLEASTKPLTVTTPAQTSTSPYTASAPQTQGQQVPDAFPTESVKQAHAPASWEKPALKAKQPDPSLQAFADMQNQIDALKQQQQQQTFYGDAPKSSKIKADTSDPNIKYIPPANTPAPTTANDPETLKYQEKLAALDKSSGPGKQSIKSVSGTTDMETETIIVGPPSALQPAQAPNPVEEPVAPAQQPTVPVNVPATEPVKTEPPAVQPAAVPMQPDTTNQQLAAEKAKLEAEKQALDTELAQMQAEKLKLEQDKAKLDALTKQQAKEFYTLKNSTDSLKLAGTHTGAVTADTTYELFNVPLEVGAVAVMRNIYFVADAAYIQKKSYPELDKLVAFMKQNSTLKVEIGGHTNGLCDDVFCNKLSNDRARSVLDYLVSRGIDIKKLSSKGYGKQQLIANPGDAVNQRVEIKILSLQ